MGQTRVETEKKIHTRTIKISCKISLKEVSLEFYLTGKLATFCQLGKCLVLKSYSDTVFRNLLANLQKSTWTKFSLKDSEPLANRNLWLYNSAD